MQHRWQSLANGEVAIESFDVVFILIEAIAVKDTRNLMRSDCSGAINLKVDQERMEVICGHDDLSIPILENGVIGLFVDCYRSEEGHVGHREVQVS